MTERVSSRKVIGQQLKHYFNVSENWTKPLKVIKNTINKTYELE